MVIPAYIIMDFDFNYNRKFNLLIGVSLYPPDFFPRWPFIFRVFYKIYEIAGCIGMLLQMMGNVAMIFMHYDNINVLCTSGGCTIFILQVPLKIIVIKIHEKIFNQCVKSISETSKMLCKNPVGDLNFPELHEKYYRKIRTIIPIKAGFEFGGFVSMMLFYVIKGVFYEKPEERVMPAPMWTPFDYQEKNNYVAFLFFESFSCLCALLRNTALDVFFCTLLITTSTQLKYLKHLQMKMVEEYETKREEILKTDKDGVFEKICIIELENNLRWWTRMHQRILKQVLMNF